MNSGTIMSLNKRTAVVLTQDGQFIRVKRLAGFEVGAEISGLKVVRANPRVRRRIWQGGAMASAMLLVLFAFLVFRAPPVVAYVTMDINPSIELGLDAKERVRELRAVNSEAQTLIEGMKYRGRNLETVMNELALRLVEEHAITLGKGEIVIASVPVKSLTKQWENAVTGKITRILNDASQQDDPANTTKLDVTTVSLPAEVRDEATANGVSSGKMAFWLVSESQGRDVTLERIKNESLTDIAAEWGGVHKVMSKYEDKQEISDDKGDKGVKNGKDDDKGDKGVKNGKDDKDDKGVKAGKDDKDDKGVKAGKDDKDDKGNKINVGKDGGKGGDFSKDEKNDDKKNDEKDNDKHVRGPNKEDSNTNYGKDNDDRPGHNGKGDNSRGADNKDKRDNDIDHYGNDRNDNKFDESHKNNWKRLLDKVKNNDKDENRKHR
ncbi:anti-sigma factor domain-containing protein [Cohnella lupini]|uniref:Anti-sigma factor-like protein n=1 Tax=Cohnella lupini TaxID=1294267 RepID=A0A3D9IQ03_9BACL|nr:anti-sigma factor domain-containing protein [Cohnella lupini]RED63815.1 anti-sigma factor-like protein [Cohnella lupini]